MPVSVIKMQSLVGLSTYSAFHWWSAQCAACMLLLSDELMSCCAAGTNVCLDLRCHASALDGRVSAEWSRCLGSMAQHARGSVAPFQWSSADWRPLGIRRLSAGVGRGHLVTIHKVSLMAGSIRQVWLLQHQTGTQYSVVECTMARVAVRRVVAPVPQQEPASCLRNVTAGYHIILPQPQHPQRLLKGPGHSFLKVDKTNTVDMLCILTNFSKICLRVKICSAALYPAWKLHWQVVCCVLIFSTYLVYTSCGRLRTETSL